MILKLRTPWAHVCLAALDRMKHLYLQFHHDLDPTDQAHFLEYFNIGYQFYDDGLFDEAGLLNKSDWAVHNFRYDFNSIQGTHGEMLVHIIRNRSGGKTRSQSFSHLKSDELSGKDGLVYNPTWKSTDPITFQVKLMNTTHSGEVIKLYTKNYFKEEYDVHRFTLVDIDENTFVEMSYPQIKEVVQNQPDSPVILERYIDNNPVVLLSRSELLTRRKTFQYTEYVLK